MRLFTTIMLTVAIVLIWTAAIDAWADLHAHSRAGRYVILTAED